MNKTQIPELDISQPVILETTIEGIGNFAITGMYDEVAPYIMSHVEAVESPAKVKTDKVPVHAVEAATHTSFAATGPIERVRTDLRVKAYDFMYGTHFMDMLIDKRNTERDLRFAGSIGLLDVEPCAKHRKALQAVRKVR